MKRKATLTGILTYHLVSGAFNAAAVINAINANNGSFSVTTVQGESIVSFLVVGYVILTDAKGGTSKVVLADVISSDGIIRYGYGSDALILRQCLFRAVTPLGDGFFVIAYPLRNVLQKKLLHCWALMASNCKDRKEY